MECFCFPFQRRLVDFADDLTVKHSQDVKVYPTKAVKTDLPEKCQADPGE